MRPTPAQKTKFKTPKCVGVGKPVRGRVTKNEANKIKQPPSTNNKIAMAGMVLPVSLFPREPNCLRVTATPRTKPTATPEAIQRTCENKEKFLDAFKFIETIIEKAKSAITTLCGIRLRVTLYPYLRRCTVKGTSDAPHLGQKDIQAPTSKPHLRQKGIFIPSSLSIHMKVTSLYHFRLDLTLEINANYSVTSQKAVFL
jgi:hypothetical protein